MWLMCAVAITDKSSSRKDWLREDSGICPSYPTNNPSEKGGSLLPPFFK